MADSQTYPALILSVLLVSSQNGVMSAAETEGYER